MDQEPVPNFVDLCSKFTSLKNGCDTAILARYLSGNQAKKKPITISGHDSTVLTNLNQMMDVFQSLLKDSVTSHYPFGEVPDELQSFASWQKGNKSQENNDWLSELTSDDNDPLAGSDSKTITITITKSESQDKTPKFTIRSVDKKTNSKNTNSASPWICVPFIAPKSKPKGLLNEFSHEDYEYAKAWVANKLDTERNRYMLAREAEKVAKKALSNDETSELDEKPPAIEDGSATSASNHENMLDNSDVDEQNGFINDATDTDILDKDTNNEEKDRKGKKSRGEPKFPGRPRFSNEERLDIYTFYLQFRRLYMAERIWEFVNEKYSVPHSTLIRLVKDIEQRRSAARLKPRKTGPRKLTLDQVKQIVEEYETTMMSWNSLGEHPGVRPLAAKYGVSRQTVLQILKEHNVKLITSKERRALRLKAYGREYEPWAEKDRKWSKEIRELEAQRGFDRNSLNGVTLPKPIPPKPRAKNPNATPRKSNGTGASNKKTKKSEPIPPMDNHTQDSDLNSDPSTMSRSSCNMRSVEAFPSLSVEQLVGATYPHSSQSIVPHSSYLTNFHATQSSNHYAGNLTGNLQSNNIYSQAFNNWSGNVSQTSRPNRPQYSQPQY